MLNIDDFALLKLEVKLRNFISSNNKNTNKDCFIKFADFAETLRYFNIINSTDIDKDNLLKKMYIVYTDNNCDNPRDINFNYSNFINSFKRSNINNEIRIINLKKAYDNITFNLFSYFNIKDLTYEYLKLFYSLNKNNENTDSDYNNYNNICNNVNNLDIINNIFSSWDLFLNTYYKTNELNNIDYIKISFQMFIEFYFYVSNLINNDYLFNYILNNTIIFNKSELNKIKEIYKKNNNNAKKTNFIIMNNLKHNINKDSNIEIKKEAEENIKHTNKHEIINNNEPEEVYINKCLLFNKLKNEFYNKISCNYVLSLKEFIDSKVINNTKMFTFDVLFKHIVNNYSISLNEKETNSLINYCVSKLNNNFYLEIFNPSKEDKKLNSSVLIVHINNMFSNLLAFNYLNEKIQKDIQDIFDKNNNSNKNLNLVNVNNIINNYKHKFNSKVVNN